MNSREKGIFAENLVINEYINRGYVLLNKDFRYKNIGEIDIVLSHNEIEPTLVFCEVKCRKNSLYYRPVEAVNFRKQSKILKTAEYYLISNNLYNKISIRFDIAEVIEHDNKYLINIIENAFP